MIIPSPLRYRVENEPLSLWPGERPPITAELLRCAIMISGSGSGMESLLHHQKKTGCRHQTVLVISDRKDAMGIQRAKNLGVPIKIIELEKNSEIVDFESINLSNFTHFAGKKITDMDWRQRISNRINHELSITSSLQSCGADLIVLSGWMRLLTPVFVDRWLGRLINIHPSLLPKFPGAHAHRDALASGSKESGCTVHLVDHGMDTGPIIAQAKLDIYPTDNEQSLQTRIKKLEHLLYPFVIDSIVNNLILDDGHQLSIRGVPKIMNFAELSELLGVGMDN